MKRSTPFLTFLVGSLVGAGLLRQLSKHQESVEALVLLEKAQRAVSSATYSGTSLTKCYFPQEVETRAKVWHEGANRQRIQYLSGELAGVTVGCDGTRNWQSDADLKKVTVAGSRVTEEQANQRFDLLVRNYRVTLDAAGVVANRPVYILTIRPRHAINAWRRLWVDQRTFVTLRNEEFKSDGKLKTRTIFEKIKYSLPQGVTLFNVPSSKEGGLISVPTAATRPLSCETLEGVYGLAAPEPRHLPAGYELDRHYLYRCKMCDCGDKAVLSRYVDGLNTISIFTVDVDRITCEQLHRKQGASGTQSSCCSLEGKTPSVDVKKGGKHYRMVVVGDIAESELKRIAESLK